MDATKLFHQINLYIFHVYACASVLHLSKCCLLFILLFIFIVLLVYLILEKCRLLGNFFLVNVINFVFCDIGLTKCVLVFSLCAYVVIYVCGYILLRYHCYLPLPPSPFLSLSLSLSLSPNRHCNQQAFACDRNVHGNI